MKELVIAAWDRDYSWISLLNSDIKVTIYNKNIETLKESEILISPNVGRDVHTFFYHIVENYDNLSDYTFFSQDYPFDHVLQYFTIINSNPRHWDIIAVQKSEGCWFFNSYYRGFRCDKHGNPQHTGLNIELVWNQLFDYPIFDSIEFTVAGHFCISKECVHKHPINFYKKILNILENNEQAPWILERLEPYVLLDIIPKEYLKYND